MRSAKELEGRISGALPETGFCAVSVAGGDLAQFNVAFPGTGARTFSVTRCASGGVVSVGVVSCVLDRPLWCVEGKAVSGYFCPLGGTG